MSKRGKFRFAAALAERMSDEELAEWLREVMAGRDPDAPKPRDGQTAPAFVTPPSWKDRMKAAQLYIEHRGGKPPQAVTIEDARENASRGGTKGLLTPEQRAALDTTKRNELRAMLREVTGGAPRALPAEVVAARDANPPKSDDER